MARLVLILIVVVGIGYGGWSLIRPGASPSELSSTE